jgi:hypothetical protein
MTQTHAASQRRISRARAVAALAMLASCVAALLPAGASADVGQQIVERCGHGQSLSGYTVAQYKRALQEMEAEAIEYSNCAELIQQAELKAAAKGKAGSSSTSTPGAPAGSSGGPGGGVGGSADEGGGSVGTGNTPIPFLDAAERQTVEQARHGKAAPVHVGAGTVLPGIVHANLASATSSLPVPLLAAIAIVCAGLLLLAGREIKDRIARSRPAG